MKLRHRVQHILRKPPRVIAWKVCHHALRHARRFGYWSRVERRLAAEVDAMPMRQLTAVLASAPQLLRPQGLGEIIGYVQERLPEESAAIVRAADDYIALRFSYMGWVRHFEDLPLPWTTDWGTNRAWDNQYYADYDYSEPGRPSDVKSCWEPSRFHFAITLGQAYRLTGKKKYREHFFRLLRDWNGQNPYAESINWTSPLEVAIRGVNLACAASLFADAPEVDLRFLVRLLARHGAFVHRNVEYTDVRGNHYTGNLLGLLALGLLLEGVVSEARRWSLYAEKHIASEVLLQYCADGVNREKSIPYHRFVTEMFLLTAILLERAGRPLPPLVQERLRSAIGFTWAYTRPDGTAPIIGDNDNARALPLGNSPLLVHGHLCRVGERLWSSHSWDFPEDTDGSDEALWLFGPPSSGRHEVVKEAASGLFSFPDGGFYVFRTGGHYLIVDAGHVGLQSGGCHGHHDMLSFELVLDGVPLVVDPGCPFYTGNIAKKNQFRATAHHNTAAVDGVEQGLLNPQLIWHLGPEAAPLDVGVEELPDGFRFSGAHVGYHRLAEPVTHRRTLTLCHDGAFQGRDDFLGSGTHAVEVSFHFAPEVTIAPCEGGVAVRAGAREWLLGWIDAQVCCTVESGEVSPGYGEILPADVVRLSRNGPLPWTLDYQIVRR